MFDYTYHFDDGVLCVEFSSCDLDPRTLEEALDLSVQKWVYIAEVLEPLLDQYGDVEVDLADGAWSTCGLCIYHNRCDACMIGEHCDGTPHADFICARILSVAIKAAWAEAAFLRGLQ